MKHHFGTLVLAGVLLFAGAGLVTMHPTTGSAVAAESTVVLTVDGLKGNCPSCAFIVRRALSSVDGVAGVEVSTQSGTAAVTFDDARTDIAALTAATANVGFPSRPLDEAR